MHPDILQRWHDTRHHLPEAAPSARQPRPVVDVWHETHVARAASRSRPWLRRSLHALCGLALFALGVAANHAATLWQALLLCAGIGAVLSVFVALGED